jgi:hypothetical protein
MNKVALHQLRVNVKSLASEAKIIRHEVKKSGDREVADSLHAHRMTRLKPEARLANLALAYVKGKNYSQVENNSKTKPSASALTRKLKRFVWQVDEPAIANWLS